MPRASERRHNPPEASPPARDDCAASPKLAPPLLRPCPHAHAWGFWVVTRLRRSPIAPHKTREHIRPHARAPPAGAAPASARARFFSAFPQRQSLGEATQSAPVLRARKKKALPRGKRLLFFFRTSGKSAPRSRSVPARLRSARGRRGSRNASSFRPDPSRTRKPR